jgi:hypothetical protein
MKNEWLEWLEEICRAEMETKRVQAEKAQELIRQGLKEGFDYDTILRFGYDPNERWGAVLHGYHERLRERYYASEETTLQGFARHLIDCDLYD